MYTVMYDLAFISSIEMQLIVSMTSTLKAENLYLVNSINFVYCKIN